MRLSANSLIHDPYYQKMSFFVILIALLLEQVRPLGTGNPVYTKLRHWAHAVERWFDTSQPVQSWIVWGLVVGIPALGVACIFWVLWRFSSVLGFVWTVAVLYVAVGFRQFSYHFAGIRQALEAGDDLAARERLAQWLQIAPKSLPRMELLRQVIEQSVLSAHRRVFGVLVCFVIGWMLGLGPAMAVFYRVAEHLSRSWPERTDSSCSPALQAVVARTWQWLDFLPARATALCFAVVGNFEEAVASWRSEALRYAPGSNGVLLAAASGAVGVWLLPVLPGEQEEAFDGTSRPLPQIAHLSNVVGLVWRSVVLWMLLLALFSLARLPV